MRILVFEYVTGGGMAGETLPPALAREGGLMLEALLDDLAKLPAVETIALRDTRLPVPERYAGRIEWAVLAKGDNAEHRFSELLPDCDAVWPIAPETAGILERLCSIVEASGKGLLACPSAAVRIAASKSETARRLAACGIPVVPTLALSAAQMPELPQVIKPDDGVGCEDARIIETPADWRQLAQPMAGQNYVTQPWIAGTPMSLSALFAHGEARLLSVNRQQVRRDNGGLSLKGCEINPANTEIPAYHALAQAIAAALPELWGYAGIDFIQTSEGPHVLEINPRLTTSYVGLSDSTGLNLAELTLSLWQQGRLPEACPLRRTPVEISLESKHGD